MLKRSIAVAAVVLAGAAAAQSSAGNPIQGDPIRAKVEDPVFLDPTPACPALRAHTQLVSDAGATIGSSMFCVTAAPFDGTTGLLTEVGTLTLHLPGGDVVTRATIVDDLAVYPVVQTISGTVRGGDGLYRGATGTLSGGGTITFDENGNPVPDSTLVVDLA